MPFYHQINLRTVAIICHSSPIIHACDGAYPQSVLKLPNMLAYKYLESEPCPSEKLW